MRLTTLWHLLWPKRRGRILASRVIYLAALGQELHLNIQVFRLGHVVVSFFGNLTAPLSRIAAPWFHPLQRAALSVTLDLRHVVQLDGDGVAMLNGLARSFARSECPVGIRGTEEQALLLTRASESVFTAWNASSQGSLRTDENRAQSPTQFLREPRASHCGQE